MSIFSGVNASASALTAQRLRMDVVSSNLANMDTTRAKQVDGNWGLIDVSLSHYSRQVNHFHLY